MGTMLRAVVVGAILVTSACSAPSRSSTASAPPRAGSQTSDATDATTSPGSTTVVAVGDIARCAGNGDEATARLVAGVDGLLLTLGDTVYPSGSPSQFRDCYAPGWGEFRSRTRPVPGNHDYEQPNGRGYHEFFAGLAGDPRRGWYSYDVGDWHLVALNSNCALVGGCQKGSEQEQWLRADLAANPARCTLAYWHHPRFSSGRNHGSDPAVSDLWQALYEAGADVVLAGHEHNYERFAALDPTGAPDPARGIRQLVVGTGGRSHYGFDRPLPGSEARNGDTFGVLRIELRPGGYDWRFLPVEGASFTDSGSGPCH